jgi:hypothetical protein
MTKETEALKLALEALENGMKFVWTDPEREAGFVAIDAIKEALAQPAQKDAARYQHIKGMARAMSLDMGGNHYWHMSLRDIRGPNLDEAIDRAIEAELKEKNT